MPHSQSDQTNTHSFDIFPWNEDFNTGISEIDEQHKELVLLLNLLASQLARWTDVAALNEIFDRLAAYAVFHFEAEEAIWSEHLGEEVEVHKHHEIHTFFVETVTRLRGELSVSPIESVAEATVVFLARWLASHIIESDRRLAFTVQAMQQGKTREEARVCSKDRMSDSTQVLISIILSIYQTQSTNTIKLMREIAARQRTETALLDSQRRYERAISGTDDGLWDWTPETGYAYFSPRWK